MPQQPMPIPMIRDKLMEIGASEDRPDLVALAEAMHRRPRVRTARATSRRVTAAMAEAIRSYARRHQTFSQLEIAARFGVNPGRVSEAMNGLR